MPMREGTPPIEVIELKWSDPVPINDISGQACICAWSWREDGIKFLKFLNSACSVHLSMFQESRAIVPSDTPAKVEVPRPRGRPRKD
jgi:hypothetical protein